MCSPSQEKNFRRDYASCPFLFMAHSIRVYVFDLDGVLYRGEDAVDYAAESIARLRSMTPAPQLFFLTNNSSQTRDTYAEKLTRLGMPCTPEEIVTSASATAEYVAKAQKGEGGSVLAVGGVGIMDEMGRVGMRTIHTSDPDEPDERFDYVVVGMDRNFNYRTLWRAQQAILRGAKFVATNRDGQYPIEGGQVIPGGGAMVAALQACTDVVPVVIGKPETLGLSTILDRTGAAPDEVAMIGDRPDTDILCGNRLQVHTVLVMTGVTTPERAEELYRDHPEMRPTRTITDLREL